MRITKWIAISLIALTFVCFDVSPLLASESHETKFRWDIIQLSVSGSPPNLVFTLLPGGLSTSVAALIPAQGAGDDSKITLTGEGTFVLGEVHEVTGGGTWATATKDGSPIASGTYRVTELVFFKIAPSNFAATGLVDGFGNASDVRAGLAVLKVHYSDGENGVVVVVCNIGPPAPMTLIEGTTATKGFVDYSNPISPDGTTGNTLFHVIHNDD